MNQLLYTAQSLFPQAPKGMEVGGRFLVTTDIIVPQWMTTGGFWDPDRPTLQSGALRMQAPDLRKVAAITIDVDAYEWDAPDAVKRWGATRDERKAAMRAASEQEVLQWMADEDFLTLACESAADAGLPEKPNRVIYTGQGLCLVYWLADNEGGLNDKWTPARIKAAVSQLHEAEGEKLWWWDRQAKDVGTRLIPVPGTRHRSTLKNVQLLAGHDNITPLTPWFESLEAKYPAKSVAKAKKVAKAKGAAKPKTAKGASKDEWTYVVHDPAVHPTLEVGEKADHCPLCDGSGYKRMVAEHYSCFSCNTQFKVLRSPSLSQPVKSGRVETHLALSAHGHAAWPATTPSRLLNRARTGSGKTELMKRERMAFAPPSEWNARILAVSPTIALAKNLSKRLGIRHADAQSDLTLASESVACCFASLPTKLGGVPTRVLNQTYLMIDEAETTLSQLQGMLKGDKARKTYNLLVYTAAHAGKVMLADANAGPVCEQFMADVDAFVKSESIKMADWELWHTDAHKHDFRYIAPLVGKNKKGEETIIESSDSRHHGLILKALDQGKRLAIYTPGRNKAIALAQELRQRYPHLVIKTVVRNLSNDTQHDLSVAGLTADVLIYNNAMSTGVSFDVDGHYDEIHLLIGNSDLTDGTHVEQAVHRIRKPKCKHFFISGTVHSIINDWRCDRDALISSALRRLEAGNKAVAKAGEGVNLTSDYMASAEAKRLAFVQATVLAGSYARGLRWVMEWLAAHHNWTVIEGETGCDFVREVSTAKTQLAQQEAASVAKASPLTEEEVARVEARGADTEDEYHAFRAAKMESFFGDGYTSASESEKAKIVLECQKDRLVQKVRVYAAAQMLDSKADFAALVAAEVRANKSQTVMTAQVTVPTAQTFAEVLNALCDDSTFDKYGRAYITPLLAQSVCQRAVPFMHAAGLKPRQDVAQSPFKQLSHLLSLGGLSLRCSRSGPRGARIREYFIADTDIERLDSLSAAFIARWKAGVEANSQVALKAA